MTEPTPAQAAQTLATRYPAIPLPEEEEELFTTPHSAISRRRAWGAACLRLALTALAVDAVAAVGIAAEIQSMVPVDSLFTPFVKLAALLAFVLAIHSIQLGYQAQARARRYPLGGPALGAGTGLLVAYAVAALNICTVLVALAFSVQGMAVSR
jgi:hypothetical protein